MALFLYTIVYFISAILIIWLVKAKTVHMDPYMRIGLLSFIYTAFFGIGVIGVSNADPGFALPFPVTISLIDDISRDWSPFVNICLFVFWFFVIGSFKLYLYRANKKDTEKLEKNSTEPRA